MTGRILTIGFYLLLGLFFCFHISQCLVYGENDRNMYSTALNSTEKPLECYDCNSEYDPRCGEKFDNFSIGMVICDRRKPPEHLVDDPDRPPKPVLCRKIIQKVEGKTRVIRGCGYIRDKHDDKECFVRTGTKDVHVTYCSCNTSLCNGARRRKGILSQAALLATVLVPFAMEILIS